MDILLTTLAKRPYVFIFLLAFLFLSLRSRGIKSTIFFLLSGYGIAWLSEASSIRNGFPYGWYSYRYENLQGEWLNAGVPVWDSLSYSFLCFAGLSLAENIHLRSKHLLDSMNHSYETLRKKWFNNLTLKQAFFLALMAATFVTLLDVVIDPLAHLGKRWFLGEIYAYTSPGYYFNVPLSNFLGWFLVSFVITGVNILFEKKAPSLAKRQGPLSFLNRLEPLFSPLFYFGIFFFNWGITLYLGEFVLAGFDLAWMSLPFLLLLRPTFLCKKTL